MSKKYTGVCHDCVKSNSEVQKNKYRPIQQPQVS